MTFYEAINAARYYSKRVRITYGRGMPSCAGIAMWRDSLMVWNNGSEVSLSERNLDASWEIVPDPQKLYTFTEAYQMMKAGKWMKCASMPQVYRYSSSNGWVYRKDVASQSIGSIGFVSFSPEMIESQWQEVEG